jgi:NDP-sugar pyrophosphorylase family protein
LSVSSICRALDAIRELEEIGRVDGFSSYSNFAHRFIENWDDRYDAIVADRSEPVISELASVHATAILGPSVVVCPGASVGPYCYLKSKVIVGPNTKLGYNVEADRLILMSGCKIAHTACVGRSIFGSSVNLGFGFVNATRHLKGKPIRVWVSERDSWNSIAKHHGTVIGAGVQSGIHASTMPGTTVEPGSIIFPSQSVSKYLKWEK